MHGSPGKTVSGKVFHAVGASPLQAENEFQNLEAARLIHPDNVVKAQAPADPRQGWIVKAQVTPSDRPKDLVQRTTLLQAFRDIPDAQGNLMWGTTADDPTPRWILIE
jgi:hypothetical protein